MRIPRLGKNNRQDTAVQRPTIDPRTASAGARGMAQVADSATQFLDNLNQKRIQAENNDYVRETSLDYSKSVYEKEKELKLKYSGDHKGYSDEMNEFLREKQESYLEGAPSEDSRKEMKYRLDQLNQSQYQSANSYENKKRAENFNANQAKIVQQTSVRYYEDPNPVMALKEMPMTLSDLDREIGVTANEDRIRQMQNDYISNTRQSLVQGLLDKGEYGIAEQVMTSDQYADLRVGMEEKEARRFGLEIQKRKEQADKLRITKVNDMASNAINFNLSGSFDPVLKEQSLAVGREIESLPDGPEKVELMDTYQKSMVVGDAMSKIKGMKASDMASISPEKIIGGDLESFKSDSKMRSLLGEAIRKDIKARNDDSAGYIESYNPALAGPGKIQDRMELAKELGVGNIRAISKAESKAQIAKIQNAPTPQVMAQEIDNILNTYGKDSKYALADMVEDGLEPSYMIAANFDDNEAKALVLDNIKNKKVLDDKSFGEVRESSTLPAMRSEVNNKVKDIEKTIRNSYSSLGRDGASEAYVNSIREVVYTDAKRRMMADDTLSYSKAVDRAYEATVSKMGTPTFKSSNSVQDHSALVPKNVDPRTVDAFFKQYSDASMLEQMNVSGKYQLSDMPADEFREYVADNGYWTTNKSGDGVHFIFNDPNDKQVVLRNDSGSPVEVKFKDMGTQKFGKVNKEISSFWGYREGQGPKMTSSSGKVQ